MSDFTRKSGVVLFAVASVLAGAANAEANPAARNATMSLGTPAAAPSGFLEFCRREPAQCRPAQPEVFDANAVAQKATTLYWANVFAHQVGGQAPAQTSTITTSPFSRQTLRTFRDWKSLSSRSSVLPAPTSDPIVDQAAAPREPLIDTPQQVVDIAEVGSTDVVTPAVVAPEVVTLDRAHWTLLNTVNRDVNRRIRQVSDERAYGKIDYWQAPTQDGAAGDCEDFVLAKREALIKAGVPASALSIAVVETRWGETHAVLIVAGDTGDYVMDNLSSWISRWDRVGYTWKQRQAPGKIFEWVNVAA